MCVYCLHFLVSMLKGQNFKNISKTRKVIKKWKSLENFSLYLNDFTFIYFFLKVRLIN